jgi:hypothetical protein
VEKILNGHIVVFNNGISHHLCLSVVANQRHSIICSVQNKKCISMTRSCWSWSLPSCIVVPVTGTVLRLFEIILHYSLELRVY